MSLLEGLRSAIWFPFFVLSLLANIAQLWGFWPSGPQTSPAPPTTGGDELQVPFLIRNDSAAFPINNLSVTCAIDQATSENRMYFTNVAVGSNAPNKLEPLAFGWYICPLRQALPSVGKLNSAVIHFNYEYDSPIPFLGRVTSMSPHFVLSNESVPVQWIPGDQLR
jgi:hypothetical protein